MTAANIFLETCNLRPTPYRPLWLMRQAGRYLPEYRQVREKHSFKEMISTPELCLEITMQPIQRYSLDAAIIFSDILVVLEALGVPYEIVEGQGPVLEQTVTSPQELSQLSTEPVNGQLGYVYTALGQLRATLPAEVALLGFAGAPWTLACYLIDGGNSKGGFSGSMSMLRDNPELLHQILDLLTVAVIAHLKSQLEAGADAVQVFDSWAGMLDEAQFRAVALPNLRRIAQALKGEHVIFFMKGAAQYLQADDVREFSILSVDHTHPLSYYRQKLGDQLVLQGNLDPGALKRNPEDLMEQTLRILEDHGPQPGHIFNLGHGITPDVPVEHVQVLVDAVRDFTFQEQG